MPLTTFPIEDYALAMPNGVTLTVIDGELDIDFTVEPAEPDVGLFAPWPQFDVDGPVCVTAADTDGRQVRLALPVRHPAVTALVREAEDRILDQIMTEELA